MTHGQTAQALAQTSARCKAGEFVGDASRRAWPKTPHRIDGVSGTFTGLVDYYTAHPPADGVRLLGTVCVRNGEYFAVLTR